MPIRWHYNHAATAEKTAVLRSDMSPEPLRDAAEASVVVVGGREGQLDL